MTTDKLICAVDSGKYEGATFVVGEEYIMESTFLAKLFLRVWFNEVTELEGIPLPTRLAVFHRILSSGREGAAPLIVKMEDRLSGD